LLKIVVLKKTQLLPQGRCKLRGILVTVILSGIERMKGVLLLSRLILFSINILAYLVCSVFTLSFQFSSVKVFHLLWPSPSVKQVC